MMYSLRSLSLCGCPYLVALTCQTFGRAAVRTPS